MFAKFFVILVGSLSVDDWPLRIFWAVINGELGLDGVMMIMDQVHIEF